jgi:protein CpxP
MKKLMTGLAVIVVATVWMTGSWVFLNSFAVGADTPAAAEVGKHPAKDHPAHGGPCGHHQWRHHRHHGFLWKKLNLTDVQKNQMHTVREEEKAKMKPLVQQLKAGREQLKALRQSGPFNEAKVRAIAKGQSDTIVELIVEKQRMMSRMYEILTPEQKTKLEELQKAWKLLHGPEERHKG